MISRNYEIDIDKSRQLEKSSVLSVIKINVSISKQNLKLKNQDK